MRTYCFLNFTIKNEGVWIMQWNMVLCLMNDLLQIYSIYFLPPTIFPCCISSDLYSRWKNKWNLTRTPYLFIFLAVVSLNPWILCQIFMKSYRSLAKNKLWYYQPLRTILILVAINSFLYLSSFVPTISTDILDRSCQS